MVLRNYVELEPGIPARMHFADHAFTEKEIRDPATGLPKVVRTLVFQVDRLDREPTGALYSVTSEKLAVQLQPYLEGKRYRDVDFVITRSGSGFLTEYQVRPEPRSP